MSICWMCAWKNKETNTGMKQCDNEWIITNASLCPYLTTLTRNFVSAPRCFRFPPSTCSTCHRLFPLQGGRRWFFLFSSCTSLFKHLFLMWTIFSLYWDCYNIASVLSFGFFGHEAYRILDIWPRIESALAALEGEVLNFGLLGKYHGPAFDIHHALLTHTPSWLVRPSVWSLVTFRCSYRTQTKQTTHWQSMFAFLQTPRP